MKIIHALAAGVLACAALAVYADDTTADTFKYKDQSYNYGRGGSNFPAGGSLAWIESYYLDGYLDLYDSTHSMFWMEKADAHINAMLANAVSIDPTGHGMLSWADTPYSHLQIKNDDFTVIGPGSGVSELLPNANFTTYSGTPSEPSNWTVNGTNGSTDVYLSTATGDQLTLGSTTYPGIIVTSDGSFSLAGAAQGTTPSSFPYLVSQAAISIPSGSSGPYRLSGYMSVPTEQSDAVIDIVDAATGYEVAGSVLRCHHVGYEYYTVNVTLPVGNYRVRLGLQNPQCYIQPAPAGKYEGKFACVSLKKISGLASQILKNPSFSPAASLPATTTWNFATGTGSNVATTTTLNQYYSAVGLAITNGSSGTAVQTLPSTYTGGGLYTLSLTARVTNPNYSGSADVYDLTTGSEVMGSLITFNSATWASHSTTFTMPASGHSLEVRLLPQSGAPATTASFFGLVELNQAQQVIPDAWTIGGTGYMINSASAHPNGPSPSCGLELDGNLSSATQQILNFTPGAAYSVTIAGRVSDSLTSAVVKIVDTTTSTTVATSTFGSTSGSSWVMNFTTPSSATDNLQFQISVSSTAATPSVWSSAVTLGQRWPQQVAEGIVGAAILRFVNEVHADSALSATYGTDAATFLSFVDGNLYHKWDNQWLTFTGAVDGQTHGIYTFPSGNSTEWFAKRTLPYNQFMAFARMLYQLHDATAGNPTYATDYASSKTQADQMTRTYIYGGDGTFGSTNPPGLFINPYYTTTSNYAWDYWDQMLMADRGFYYPESGSPTPPPYATWLAGPAGSLPYSPYAAEDNSHGALDIANSISAFMHRDTTGPIFTSAIRNGQLGTLLNVMWNGNLTDPVVVAKHVYQHGTTVWTTADMISTASFLQWAQLGQFNRTSATSDAWDVANAVVNDNYIPTLPYAFAAVGAWSKNRVINNGFEIVDDVDNTLPMNWTRWNSGTNSSNAFMDTTTAYRGAASICIKTDGGNWHVLQSQIPKYEPNTIYTVSYAGRIDTASTQGRVQIWDNTTSTVLNQDFFSPTPLSWTTRSFSFRTPSSGHDLEVRVYTDNHTTSGQSIWVDELRTLPDGSNSEVANGGFELSDYYDSTLPRFWIRPGGGGSAVLGTTAYEGLSGLQVTGGGTGPQILYTWQGYVPGKTYTLSLNAYCPSGSSGGQITVIDESTSPSPTTLLTVTVPSSASTWTTFTGTFTAPSVIPATHTITVNVTASGSGTLWLDEVQLTH